MWLLFFFSFLLQFRGWLTTVFSIASLALDHFPDSKVNGANMGPTWVLSAPDGPHVGPMNLAIRVVLLSFEGNMPSDEDISQYLIKKKHK